MKKSLLLSAALALAALCMPAAAQTVMPANLSWTNPSTLTDGTPLTGANVLTAIEVHWATATITGAAVDQAPCSNPCTGARTPQATLGVVATSTHSIPATNGQTFFFRLKAVNAAGKSMLSNEASKVASIPVPPGPPTNLRVDFVVSQDDTGRWSMAMVVREAWELTIYNGG